MCENHLTLNPPAFFNTLGSYSFNELLESWAFLHVEIVFKMMFPSSFDAWRSSCKKKKTLETITADLYLCNIVGSCI